MMKIGILGSGNMGRAIGVRCAQAGYEVCFGARESEKSAEAAELAGHGSSGADMDSAGIFGDLLIWTLRENDPSKVFVNPAVLTGKITVDINNRDYENEVRTGAWFEQSLAEQLQSHAPASKVVKAFNTIAMESFDISAADLRKMGAQTFLAGDDAEAKRLVGELVSALGFEPIDMGAGRRLSVPLRHWVT